MHSASCRVFHPPGTACLLLMFGACIYCCRCCCQVDWDKGRALLHLLEVLGLQQQADVLPIYIGDDKTDEDAFRALQDHTGATPW